MPPISSPSPETSRCSCGTRMGLDRGPLSGNALGCAAWLAASQLRS
jgi:hypothetical protein